MLFVGFLLIVAELTLGDDMSHIQAKPSEATGQLVHEFFMSGDYEYGNAEELGEYLEGDILMPEGEMVASRNGVLRESSRWPNGEIPFEIRGLFTARDMDLIERAIVAYHDNTCIKFIPRRNTDKDYLSLESGTSGCWSNVGKVGGKQVINLQSGGCTTKIGTIIHELMHSVGFYHEQNREERDSHVEIRMQNVKPGMEVNFRKLEAGKASGFGVGYDYGSVMHYSRTAFSKNGQPTIYPKASTSANIGQREGFSRMDIDKINRMYKCTATTTSTGYKPSRTSFLGILNDLIG